MLALRANTKFTLYQKNDTNEQEMINGSKNSAHVEK